jgi:hypothetical protein
VNYLLCRISDSAAETVQRKYLCGEGMRYYSYRVEELVFCDGQVLIPGSITVLVGPNNGGKSQALRDIHKPLTGRTRGKCKCIVKASFALPSHAEDLRYVVQPQWHDKQRMWAFRTLRANMTGTYWSRIAESNHFRGDPREWLSVVDSWLSLPSDRAGKSSLPYSETSLSHITEPITGSVLRMSGIVTRGPDRTSVTYWMVWISLATKKRS